MEGFRVPQVAETERARRGWRCKRGRGCWRSRRSDRGQAQQIGPGLEPQHGARVPDAKRLAADGRGGRLRRAGPALLVAGRGFAPASRQCRRGARGPGGPALHPRQPVCRAARRRAAAMRAARRGRGHRALRDRAGPAAADRLGRHCRAPRRGDAAHPPVHGHAGLQPALLRDEVSGRAPIAVAPRPGRSVPALWRRAAGRVARQVRAPITVHDVQSREAEFNDGFHAFCRSWGVARRACAPYQAWTKDKMDAEWVASSTTSSPATASRARRRCRPHGALDARDRRPTRARHHWRAVDPALRAWGRGARAATGEGVAHADAHVDALALGGQRRLRAVAGSIGGGKTPGRWGLGASPSCAATARCSSRRSTW